jgi:D-alanyl-lipoteichoic acid acyltransferase DltB (MBOAT superfamily)
VCVSRYTHLGDWAHTWDGGVLLYLHYETLNFLDSWLVSLSFTFQLYFDFGGYIDMATGIALLFNIRIPQNFNSPYKASSIIDFWQRWHITLTSFLTSYIYFPILRSLKIVTFFKTMIVTIFVFFIAGIWHGPTWFYILFGLFHGLGVVINHCYIKFLNRKLNFYFSWFLTFNFVNISLVFFRSEETSHTINILKNMFGFNGFDISNYNEYNFSFYITFLIAVIVCFFFKNTNYLVEESYKKYLSNKKV